MIDSFHLPDTASFLVLLLNYLNLAKFKFR